MYFHLDVKKSYLKLVYQFLGEKSLNPEIRK